MIAPNPASLSNENAQAALSRAHRDQPQPVLIAGAGIGGLAAALALAQRGIPTHILERRPAFHEEGAGIQIGPNGTRILRQLGVADALYPYVGVPESICVREGASGDELTRLPLGRWIEMRHGAPYWVAQRKDLHTTLAQAVRADPLIVLSMGFSVEEIATDGHLVAVASGDGNSWTGKALIAADGIWSQTRTSQFQSEPPQFAGKSAARSVLSLEELPPEYFTPETGVWLFPGAHVVHYPVSAGRALAIVVIVDDEHDDDDWGAPVPPAWVQRRVPHCAQSLSDLLSAVHTWKRWALHTLPVPRHWVRGPVALLGDAAHPVLPFLAQGGVLALEDAIMIADAIAGFHKDIPAALKWYEQRRIKRAARVARASRENGRIYHLSGPLARARNLVLRMAPPQRLMARYDWLYGWRPS